jgi:hypothetical protein
VKALVPLRRCLPQVVLAAALLAAAAWVWPLTSPSPPRAQADSAAAEKQVTLLYTVNNSGYTDVCG